MKRKSIFVYITFISLGIALLYPGIVDWLYQIGEKHPVIITTFGPSEALSYGGTIIGSIIAGSLTLLGVVITLLAQKEEQKEENKRLVKPMLKISTDESDYRNRYIQFDAILTEESKTRERKDIADTKSVTIKVTNVGQRELMELYAGDFSGTFFDEGGHSYKVHPVLYSGSSISLEFSFYEKGVYDYDLDQSHFGLIASPLSFKFYFKDCLENWYSQKFQLYLFHSIIQGVPMEKSALNISIERVDICSAPELVTENELPWIQDDSKLIGYAW